MRTGIFLKWLLLVVALLMLVMGCRAAEPPKPVAGVTPTPTPIIGTGTATFVAIYITDGFSSHLNEWVEDFGEDNPELEFELEIVSETGLRDRLASAQGLPDVMLLPAEYVADLAARDLLNTDMPASVIEEAGIKKYYPIPLAQVRSSDDTLLAVPYYGATQGVWYRKDLFEEKGLDAPNTLENLLKAAEALHDPAGPIYGIALPAGGDGDLAHHALAHLAQGAGAQGVAQDGSPQFTDPAFVGALQSYADLAEFGPPDEVTISEARDLFLGNKLAMILDFTSLPQALADRSTDVRRDEMSRKMGFVAAIGDGQEAGATYAHTLALAVGKDANADAARAWINYLIHPSKGYTIYWIPEGWAPAMSAIAFQWRAQKGHDWFGYYEAGMPEDLLDGLRKAPGWGVSSDASNLTRSRVYAARLFPTAVDKVLSGEMDGEQAAAWLQDEAAKLK